MQINKHIMTHLAHSQVLWIPKSSGTFQPRSHRSQSSYWDSRQSNLQESNQELSWVMRFEKQPSSHSFPLSGVDYYCFSADSDKTQTSILSTFLFRREKRFWVLWAFLPKKMKAFFKRVNLFWSAVLWPEVAQWMSDCIGLLWLD